MRFAKTTLILSSLLFAIGCSSNKSPSLIASDSDNQKLYSLKGREHQVQFEALFRSRYKNIEELKERNLIYDIKRTTPFLFGPLTYRSLGGVQKGENVFPFINQAYLENGRVMVPYRYEATWLIEFSSILAGSLRLPLPYSVESLRETNWRSCTDTADEEHGTWGFLWYFWDPSRPGCEHELQVDYQEVEVKIGTETVQTKQTFPEYQRMIRLENGVPTMAMTFAFGYVSERQDPKPFKDNDFGMREFQKFHQQVKSRLLSLGFKEIPIYQKDITEGETVIGTQFSGLKNGVQIRVSVIAAAGVDQMDVFSDSYAKKHEGFFGWFGHSRVGAGFDADILKQKLIFESEIFSMSPQYQLVYWAGCNSYSYYTLPFFEMKAELDPQNDPQGTQNLDLISNALPSLFAFNSANAQILFEALLNYEVPSSYQSLISQIESFAAAWNYRVLVNVLGDEDN